MAYLLDANVFMAANNSHYGMDFCPAFWDWLLRQHAAGRLFSIQKIADEIAAKQDRLSEWAANLSDAFFLPPNQQTLSSFGTVAEWVQSQRYRPDAISGFLSKADYYLIAQAHAAQHVVITHEVPAASTKVVKIPDVCIGLNVKCMTPYEMLRTERARFVLAQ